MINSRKILIFLFISILNLYPFNLTKDNNNEVYSASETFTTSGSWQAPAGVTSVFVELWAAGGAGGKGGSSSKYGGGGGAGGQYVSKQVTVTPLSTYNFTIGIGGTATTGNGNPGGDTTFNMPLVIAKGGAGGNSYDNGGAGGSGSITGGVGDSVYAGGSGATGNTSGSGGGGSGAGSTGTGNSATTQTGGTAKSEYGGAGGNGTTLNSGSGTSGSVYGGGG